MAANRTPEATPAPAQTRNYPTLRKWLGQAGNKARLREFLSDPVFLGFCHYVEEKNRVKLEDLTGVRPKLAEEIVRKTAVTAGLAEFRNFMKQLVEEGSAPRKEAQPWDHINPPNE